MRHHGQPLGKARTIGKPVALWSGAGASCGSPQQSPYQRTAAWLGMRFGAPRRCLRLERFDRKMEHEPPGFVFQRGIFDAVPRLAQRCPYPFAGTARIEIRKRLGRSRHRSLLERRALQQPVLV